MKISLYKATSRLSLPFSDVYNNHSQWTETNEMQEENE